MEKHFRPLHFHQDTRAIKGHKSEMCDHSEKDHKRGKSANSKSQQMKHRHQNQGQRHQRSQQKSHQAEEIDSHDLSTAEDSIFSDHHSNQTHHLHSHHYHRKQNHRHVSLPETPISSSTGSSSSSTSSSSSSSSSPSSSTSSSSSSSSFSSSSTTSSSSSSLSSQSSSECSERFPRMKHSQSCTDISRKYKYLEEGEDTAPLIDKRGYQNTLPARLERGKGKSSKGGALKSARTTAGGSGTGGSFRKTKSMEALTRPRDGEWHDDGKDPEKEKSEARKNLMKEKMKFSAFLNEITRQVLSPMRLSTLGVTDAHRPCSPGQARSRPTSADSLSSRKHTRDSSPPCRSDLHHHHHHQRHHHGGSTADSQVSLSHTAESAGDRNSDVGCERRKTDSSHRLHHSPSVKHHHHRHHGDHHTARHHHHHGDPNCPSHHHREQKSHHHHHGDHHSPARHHHHEDRHGHPRRHSRRHGPVHHHGDHHITSHHHHRGDHYSPTHRHGEHRSSGHHRHSNHLSTKGPTGQFHHGDSTNHHHHGVPTTHHHYGDQHSPAHHHHHDDHQSEAHLYHHGDHQHHHEDHSPTIHHHHSDHHCQDHHHHHTDHSSTTHHHHNDQHNQTHPHHHHGDHQSDHQHHQGDHQSPDHQHHHADHHHHHGDHHSPDHQHQHGDHQHHHGDNHSPDHQHHHGDHTIEAHHHHHGDHQHHHGDHTIEAHHHHHGDHNSPDHKHHHGDHHSPDQQHHHGDHQHHHGEHHSPDHQHHHGDHQHHHGERHSPDHQHHHGEHHSPDHQHHHGEHHSPDHQHHHAKHHIEAHHHHHGDHQHHHGEHHSPDHQHHHGEHHIEAHHHHHGDHQHHHGEHHSPDHQHQHGDHHIEAHHHHHGDHQHHRGDAASQVDSASLSRVSASSHDEEQSSFSSSAHTEKVDELGRIMMLQEQNEGLHKSLLKTAVRMECLGEEFISSQKLLETELQRTRMELNNLTERFKRLHDNCSSTQQTNSLLEQRLHLVAQSMEGERERLNRRISALTEKLADTKHANSVETFSGTLLLHTNEHDFQPDDTINQVVHPITPPPVEFMDSHNYGKAQAGGQELPLGSVPEEEESDWSELGEETPRFILTGSNRGPVWRHQEGDMDKDSELVGEEIFRCHSPRPLQIPHLQFTIHSENLSGGMAGEGTYRIATSPTLGSAILIRSASMEDIPLSHHEMQKERRGTEAMMDLHHRGGAATEDLDNQILHHWRGSNDIAIARPIESRMSEAESGLAGLQSAELMLNHFICEHQTAEGQGRAEVHGWTGGIPDEVWKGERTQL